MNARLACSRWPLGLAALQAGRRTFATAIELPFDVADVFARTCAAVGGCLGLDDLLASRARDQVFLEDGHWGAGGHRIAATATAAYLRSLAGFGAAPGQPNASAEPVLGQDDAPAADAL